MVDVIHRRQLHVECAVFVRYSTFIDCVFVGVEFKGQGGRFEQCEFLDSNLEHLQGRQNYIGCTFGN